MRGWRHRKKLVLENCGLETTIILEGVDELDDQYRLRVWRRAVGDPKEQTKEQVYDSWGKGIEAFQTEAGDVVTEEYTHREKVARITARIDDYEVG